MNNDYTKPTIVIGLGGTGVKVLRNVKTDLINKNNGRQSGKLPSNLRLLGVDTTLQIPADNLALLKENEYISAQVKEPQRYITMPVYDYIDDWWPEKIKARRAILNGAGQVRVAGRLAFFANFLRIQMALQRMINEVTELTCHNGDYRSGQSGAMTSVDIIIVASLCGGTGSGMFLDAAILAKHLLKEHAGSRVKGIFLLPSIFQDKPHTDWIFSNTYAALVEMDHLMSISSEQSRIVQYTKDFQIEVSDSIFDQTFLVDNKNEKGARVNSHRALINTMSEAIQFLVTSSFGRKEDDRIPNRENITNLQESGKYLNFSSFGFGFFVPDEWNLEQEKKEKELELALTIIEKNLAKSSASSSMITPPIIRRLDQYKRQIRVLFEESKIEIEDNHKSSSRDSNDWRNNVASDLELIADNDDFNLDNWQREYRTWKKDNILDSLKMHADQSSLDSIQHFVILMESLEDQLSKEKENITLGKKNDFDSIWQQEVDKKVIQKLLKELRNFKNDLQQLASKLKRILGIWSRMHDDYESRLRNYKANRSSRFSNEDCIFNVPLYLSQLENDVKLRIFKASFSTKYDIEKFDLEDNLEKKFKDQLDQFMEAKMEESEFNSIQDTTSLVNTFIKLLEQTDHTGQFSEKNKKISRILDTSTPLWSYSAGSMGESQNKSARFTYFGLPSSKNNGSKENIERLLRDAMPAGMETFDLEILNNYDRIVVMQNVVGVPGFALINGNKEWLTKYWFDSMDSESHILAEPSAIPDLYPRGAERHWKCIAKAFAYGVFPDWEAMKAPAYKFDVEFYNKLGIKKILAQDWHSFLFNIYFQFLCDYKISDGKLFEAIDEVDTLTEGVEASEIGTLVKSFKIETQDGEDIAAKRDKCVDDFKEKVIEREKNSSITTVEKRFWKNIKRTLNTAN